MLLSHISTYGWAPQHKSGMHIVGSHTLSTRSVLLKEENAKVATYAVPSAAGASAGCWALMQSLCIAPYSPV